MKKVIFILIMMITLFSFSNVKAEVFPNKVLWSNSFETEEEQEFWTFHDLDGDGENWEYKSAEKYGSKAYEGDKMLYSNSDQVETLNNVAITKPIEIDVTNAENIVFNWYVVTTDSYFNEETYSVYIFKGTETEEKIIETIQNESASAIFNETLQEKTAHYQERSILLNDLLKELFPNSNTKSIRIVFRHHESKNQSALKLDALSIEAEYNFEFIKSYNFEEDMEGWTSIDSDGDGYGWEHKIGENNGFFAGYNSNGTIVSASWYNQKPLTPENYLISPEIYFDDKYYLYGLSWYVGAVDPIEYKEQYSIYIYSGDEELNANNIKNKLNDNNVSSLIYNETLEDYEFMFRTKFLERKHNGKKVRIVFVHHDCTEQYYLKLDNIALYGALPTEKDTNVPENPDTPEVPEIVKGDWNGNGTIDIQDLARARLFWAGDETFEEPELEIVDMNENGKHDLTDLERIRTYLAENYNP